MFKRITTVSSTLPSDSDPRARQQLGAVRLLLGLLAEEFLGLWVVNQDLRQVLLIQDEEVSKSMRLHVGRPSVPSASRQQTDQSQTSERERQTDVIISLNANMLAGGISSEEHVQDRSGSKNVAVSIRDAMNVKLSVLISSPAGCPTSSLLIG